MVDVRPHIMKLAALIVIACTGMLTSLILMLVLLSTPGVKASTTYSLQADDTLLFITLGNGHACEEGDWVFCVRAGYVGRVKRILGDMAACEKYVAIRTAENSSTFRIF